MIGTDIQRGFFPTFLLLLVMDYLTQLVGTAGVAELQPLVALWTGPIDDIFYGIAGVQALYYLIDPFGETRDSGPMSWTGSVKRVASLLSEGTYRRAYLPRMFFTGSLRAVAGVAPAVLLAVVAHGLASSIGTTTLLIVLQRHLSFLLPVTAICGALLAWGVSLTPQRLWRTALLVGVASLTVSMAYDGRWSHHVHHLLVALSDPIAWGAAFCWIATLASLPVATLQLDPLRGEQTEAALAS